MTARCVHGQGSCLCSSGSPPPVAPACGGGATGGEDDGGGPTAPRAVILELARESRHETSGVSRFPYTAKPRCSIREWRPGVYMPKAVGFVPLVPRRQSPPPAAGATGGEDDEGGKNDGD